MGPRESGDGERQDLVNYPQGVPSPYVMHQHPYPTRFHGGIWRRPTFGLPYVRQPFNVIRPSQMPENIAPAQAGLGRVTAIGKWDTGDGVFRRPRVDGGGVFNEISGLGRALGMSATTSAFVGGGVIAFGVVAFMMMRKKPMTANRRLKSNSARWIPVKMKRDRKARGHIPTGWYCWDTQALRADVSQHFDTKKQAQAECVRRNER